MDAQTGLYLEELSSPAHSNCPSQRLSSAANELYVNITIYTITRNLLQSGDCKERRRYRVDTIASVASFKILSRIQRVFLLVHQTRHVPVSSNIAKMI